MNKDVAGKLLKACVVAACLCFGGGCKRDDAQPAPDDAAAPAAVAVDADAALVADLEGVWATSENAGTDDAETVYVIESTGAGKLRLTRDGNALETQVEDADPAQNTVTLRHQIDSGLAETLTFRKVEDENGTGGFSLSLTYGNGQKEALGFVRRLSTSDRETLATAFAPPAQAAVDPCLSVPTFRARMLCENPDLREQDEKLTDYFDFIAHRGPNDAEATRAAATNQLDACNNRGCLYDVYAKWITYLEGNYDDLELSGMVDVAE